MKIVNMPDDKSVKEAIENFSQGEYEAVMLIGLKKDGSQFLQTSKCSMMAKSLLVAFSQSYLNDLFAYKDIR